MFSDSRASAPKSGFRTETSGQVVGAGAAGCRTNQHAAHAAPKAHIEPKMLAAMKIAENQAAAGPPICSRPKSISDPVGSAATCVTTRDLRGRFSIRSCADGDDMVIFWLQLCDDSGMNRRRQAP